MNLLQLNEKEMGGLLETLRSRHFLETWRTFLWKERLIYESLNKMQLREHFLVADLYLPRAQKERLAAQVASIVPAPELQELEPTKPPTAFDTNCYTRIAQEITNTYGVPRYCEINPAIFTTVTFPFFFGVMFGDMGHGLILFLLGLYLVFNNDALKRSSLSFVCDLRYMVLMMGFFAFYCGWIYNDFLGMNVNFLGSCYSLYRKNDGELAYTHTPDCVYPLGVDPIWGIATNNLIFVNSLKMKVSVIIAIIHMVVGVILKCFNAVYFKRTLEVVFEFIPQLLFLGLLFGYMDFLIIFKWLKPWNPADASHPPPSIISTMMDIGLKTGSTVRTPSRRRKPSPCGATPASPARTPSRSSSSSSPSSASPSCSSPNPSSKSAASNATTPPKTTISSWRNSRLIEKPRSTPRESTQEWLLALPSKRKTTPSTTPVRSSCISSSKPSSSF